MIWDNFSIFRTNCAILTSYISADPRTCRGLSRGCCHVVWWNGVWELRDTLADFSQRWQGIRQRRRTRALLCTSMLWFNGKGAFLKVENFFNFALLMNKIRSLVFALQSWTICYVECFLEEATQCFIIIDKTCNIYSTSVIHSNNLLYNQRQ